MPKKQKNDPMKLTFFLIALFLILVRIVYPRLELWHNHHEQGTMITKGPNYIEGIWWAGKIRLSDDERSIAEISPGGHLKFREQDTIMDAESDLQGKISYTLQNGREELPLSDSGRRFIAWQIQKMIRLGFFAEGRAERIYKKGGAEALLAELSKLRMEGSRDPYLKLLFQADTLTVTERIKLLQLLDSSNNMMEQQHYLGLFPLEQLRDSAVAQAWLKSVDRLEQAYMKKDLLLQYLKTLTKSQEKLPADQFDTVLAVTGRFGSPEDQKEVYERLIDVPPVTNAEWIGLIRATSALQQDYLKSELLLKIAPKMPRTDSLISAYSSSAKRIQGDMDYGKVMRAIE
jgi:hypothetical protein